MLEIQSKFEMVNVKKEVLLNVMDPNEIMIPAQ